MILDFARKLEIVSLQELGELGLLLSVWKRILSFIL
jgi:hypothetical protein